MRGGFKDIEGEGVREFAYYDSNALWDEVVEDDSQESSLVMAVNASDA